MLYYVYADAGINALVFRASDVLSEGHGICFAKSHLLAALIRYAKIPCGFCYQKLAASDENPDFLVYHGLNGVYIPESGRWIRLDARGNRKPGLSDPGINAQFSVDKEQLCFRINQEIGEKDGYTVFPSPDSKVLEKLKKYRTREDLWKDLPVELAH